LQTHKQMHLRSLNLTLIRQSSKGDEWKGTCLAQEDVRVKISKRVLPKLAKHIFISNSKE
jgi:hypothetical protein